MIKKYSFFCLFFIAFSMVGTIVHAQVDSVSAGTTEEAVLNFSSFWEQVKSNHPIAQSAALQAQKGEAKLQSARGAFDPKLQFDLAEKNFEDKEYYRLLDGGIKLETPIGVQFKGGYKRNDGVFLNPQNNLPENGLLYGGVVVQLGQGMFIDARRAALKDAKIVVEMSIAEQQSQFNQLRFQAAQAYWSWYQAFRTYTVYQNAFDLAQERFLGVLEQAGLGDKAPIDTLEAKIQVNNRLMARENAEILLKNESAWLSTFLWNEKNEPLQLAEKVIPDTILNVAFLELVTKITLEPTQHPEILKKQFERDQASVAVRLAKEQLKPQLDLVYNPLANAQPLSDGETPAVQANNMEWGVNFAFPIFLRKERGKLKLEQIKLQEKNNYFLSKRNEVGAKLNMAKNDYFNAKSQAELAERIASDYQLLLNAEQQLFQNGESSLFLVNSREQSFIKAQLKWIEQQKKEAIAYEKVLLAAGGIR